ncbi:MAG: hypothetical protein UX94_C0011G0043 [Parcubacteria group bacterium GW2011_GWA2_47_21]|nr:MAG: hypothetical protein UX94_C0011G0043 [Parcubacteria group bacterium GW2011_GWA2_47_21]
MFICFGGASDYLAGVTHKIDYSPNNFSEKIKTTPPNREMASIDFLVPSSCQCHSFSNEAIGHVKFKKFC